MTETIEKQNKLYPVGTIRQTCSMNSGNNQDSIFEVSPLRLHTKQFIASYRDTTLFHTIVIDSRLAISTHHLDIAKLAAASRSTPYQSIVYSTDFTIYRNTQDFICVLRVME